MDLKENHLCLINVQNAFWEDWFIMRFFKALNTGLWLTYVWWCWNKGHYYTVQGNMTVEAFWLVLVTSSLHIIKTNCTHLKHFYVMTNSFHHMLPDLSQQKINQSEEQKRA